MQDLKNRLKNLGKGIGEVTINIFLRELRDIWDKAKPEPTSLVLLAAKNLGIIKNGKRQTALQQLRDFWVENEVEGKFFINFETALLRLGKDFCRKHKCAYCTFKTECLIPKVP
jgi:hypothetical protein